MSTGAPGGRTPRIPGTRPALAFVGREPDVQDFVRAVESPWWPFQLLYVSGPAGIGKSALLRRYREEAASRDIEVAVLRRDGLTEQPPGFLEGVARALGITVATLWERDGPRQLIIIDDVDGMDRLGRWLRTDLIPRLPARTALVVASRRAPTLAWRDVAWFRLFLHVPLMPLSHDEVAEYLDCTGVGAEHLPAVWTASYGYPLLVELAAGRVGTPGADDIPIREQPALLHTAAEIVGQDVRDPAVRAAIEVVAVAGYATEDLVTAVCGADLFDELVSLPVVEEHPGGLRVVEGLREALVASLAWRNPERHARVRRKIYRHLVGRVSQARGADLEHLLAGLLSLLWGRPELEPVISWEWLDFAHFLPACSDDVPPMFRAVEAREGPAMADIVRQWYVAAPEAFRVGLAGSRPIAFVMATPFGHAPAGEPPDPLLAAARRWLVAEAPLRNQELALLVRWSTPLFARPEPCRASTACIREVARVLVTHPGLAVGFFANDQPERWAPAMRTIGGTYVGPVELGGDAGTVGLFAVDWRPMVASSWLGTLNQPARHADGAMEAEHALILNESTFLQAVRDAVRAFADPGALRTSPLMRAHLVLRSAHDPSSYDSRTEALRARILDAADVLRTSPRHEHLYELLRRTSLQPTAATQQDIACSLELPFGTYRRHLARATDVVAQALWFQECDRPF